MKNFAKRGLSMLLALAMCLSLLSGLTFAVSADTVDYVYSGSYIYNWGSRGTTATYLSQNAEAFYADNGTSYAALAALAGASSTSDVPSSALYLALQKLMADAQTYQTSYEATKNLFQYTDCQNSGGKISSFYSGKEIGPSWDGTWNREHTWPNSKGDAAGNGENDIMMLRPTASSENSSRGNKAYGESSGYYHPNNESDGTYDLRGDVCRIMLYTYTRWGCTDTMWGSDGVIESKALLLQWMEEDPVDTWELGRNDAVESITGTRNVFVDYPELAFVLFDTAIPADYTTPSGEAAGGGYTITATANDTSCGTVSVSGTTINAFPATGYYVAGYTVVSGSATVTQSGNTFAVKAQSDCTVQVTFAPRTQLTVTYSENGTISTAAVYSGDSLTLPEPTKTVEGFTFVGWTNATLGKSDQKPDYLTAGSSYTPTASQTLYALYAYQAASNSSGNVYELYTDTLVEGDYILTYETTDIGAMEASVSSNRLTYQTVTLDDGAILSPDSKIVWHITPTDDGSYTIYNASTGSYAAGTTTNNKATLLSSVTSYATWSVTHSGDTYDFVNGGNSRYLRRNGTYGFACYAESTGGALSLYKNTGSATYYTTSATNCAHEDDVEEIAAVAATCTTPGNTAGYYCNDCDTYYGGYTYIPATGHSYSAAVTAPTETQQGYTTYTCDACGDSYISDYVAALGKTYTVSFQVPADVTPVADMLCGDAGITLPTPGIPTGEQSYSFVGWATQSVADTLELPEVYAAGTTYQTTVATTLYAVYSYLTESTGSGDYIKVTEAPSDWSGKYLIVYETGSCVLNSSLATMDVVSNYKEVTITDSIISAADGDGYHFTVAAVDGGYSIQATSGNYIGRTSDSSGLQNTSTLYTNTITLNSDGTANIIGSGGAYLRYNKSSGQNRFRYYNSGTYTGQQAICLYQLEEKTGTAYYTTLDAAACDHASTTTLTVPATCAADGSVTVSCADCGAVVSTQVLPATGVHSYTDGICTVCGGYDPETVKFTSAGVVLDSVMAVRFYTLFGSGKVTAAIGDGEAQEITASAASAVEGYYEYAVDVFAQDMTKDITANLYSADGTQLLSTRVFRLADYVSTITASEEETAYTKALAQATLTYCQYAAIIKGNFTDTANTLAAIEEGAFDSYSFDSAMGTAAGISVHAYLEDACQLRLRLSESYGTGYTVTVDGVQTELTQAEDGTWLCATAQILPQDYDEIHTFRVKQGETVVYEGTVSVLAYIGRCLKQNLGSQDVQNLLIAMYHYHIAAKAAEGLTGDSSGGDQNGNFEWS